MDLESKPAFSSPDLQKAFEETDPAIAGFEQTRDQISSDIKALEHHLERAAVNVEHRSISGST